MSHQSALESYQEVKDCAQKEWIARQEAIGLLFSTLTAKKQVVKRKADFQRWRKEARSLEAGIFVVHVTGDRLPKMEKKREILFAQCFRYAVWEV